MCTCSLNVHVLPPTVTERTVSPRQRAHLGESTVLEHDERLLYTAATINPKTWTPNFNPDPETQVKESTDQISVSRQPSISIRATTRRFKRCLNFQRARPHSGLLNEFHPGIRV